MGSGGVVKTVKSALREWK